MLVESDGEAFDFGEVTQESLGQPRMNWQAPYDERLLDELEGTARYAFFFHYLDRDRPMLTPFGPVEIPSPTPVPAHLQNIEYEAP